MADTRKSRADRQSTEASEAAVGERPLGEGDRPEQGKPETAGNEPAGKAASAVANRRPTQQDQSDESARLGQAALDRQGEEDAPAPQDPEERPSAQKYADKYRASSEVMERQKGELRGDLDQIEARARVNEDPNTVVGGLEDSVVNTGSALVKALPETHAAEAVEGGIGIPAVFHKPYGSEPRNYDTKAGAPLPSGDVEVMEGVHGLDQYPDVDAGVSAAQRVENRLNPAANRQGSRRFERTG